MWQELSQQLKNIKETPYELFVTLVEDNPELILKIKQFHPQSTVWIVPNMGYDIGPFIEFLNKIDLDKYSYILKLHSKRPTNGTDIKINNLPINRHYWKVLLSEALIGNTQIWENNLQALSQDSKLGMIGSHYLIKKAGKTDLVMLPEVQKQLQQLGLPDIKDFSFIAGTMFLVRSSLFKVLQHHYKIEDFATTDGKITDGTLAHIMERLFGAIINAQGYNISGFSHNWKFLCNASGKIILRFLYQKKTTSNKILVKILKIPVFQKKL